MHQPQTVPVLKSSFRKVPSSILKAPVSSIKTQPLKGSRNVAKDPSKLHAGCIRLRSIQYAKSVAQVINKSILNESPKVGKEVSSVALVEVIGKHVDESVTKMFALRHREGRLLIIPSLFVASTGVLVTRMQYVNNCWNFSLRDPTSYDFMRKYPVAATPNLGNAQTQQMKSTDHRALRCRMFDTNGSVDQEALERDEALRVIGIVPQTSTTEDDRNYQLLCVGIRT